MCVCECVRACVRACLLACVRACGCVCACVCACVHASVLRFIVIITLELSLFSHCKSKTVIMTIPNKELLSNNECQRTIKRIQIYSKPNDKLM